MCFVRSWCHPSRVSPVPKRKENTSEGDIVAARSWNLKRKFERAAVQPGGLLL